MQARPAAQGLPDAAAWQEADAGLGAFRCTPDSHEHAAEHWVSGVYVSCHARYHTMKAATGASDA